MAGIEKFAAAVRQGASIRRKSWHPGICISANEPGAEPRVYETRVKSGKTVTKEAADGISFNDIFANDWETCDGPDFGRTEPKKSKGKVDPPPADPMTEEGKGAHVEGTGDL